MSKKSCAEQKERDTRELFKSFSALCNEPTEPRSAFMSLIINGEAAFIPKRQAKNRNELMKQMKSIRSDQ